MIKIMEGTKVIYFDIETEIEAVQKDFINQIYRYKLKGVRDLVNYSDFFIKTDEIIDEIIALQSDNGKEIIDDDTEKFDDSNINSDSDVDVVVYAVKEIDKIIKENKPKEKSKKSK